MVEGMAKALLAVRTGIGKNGSVSSDMVIADLGEKPGGNSSARATLSRGFAEVENENAFQEAPAHCVPVARIVQEKREIGCNRDGGLRRWS